MRKNYLLILLFSLLMLAGSFRAQASHIAGADISYTCIGGDSFIVTLQVFRDCDGIALTPAGFQQVEFQSTCGDTFDVDLDFILVEEVSQLCPDLQDSSTCNNGPYPGIERYVFQDTVVMSPPCDTWRISWDICCRNPSANGVGQPLFYVETQMNSQTDSCNNSPIFTAQPVPYVCAFQSVNYNFGVIELDGDSLVYSLVNALTGPDPTDTVPYQTGFSALQPVPGTFLDSITGQLSFTPTTVGQFIFVVKVEEYDENGNLLGSITRDIQFIVQVCNNAVPQVQPGGISNFTGTGTILDSNSVEVCLGENFCFDVVINDTDTFDTLTLSSNISQILPGATFTATGVNPATATVCWNAVPVPGSFVTFNIFVEDDACPVAGVVSTTYDITIVGTTFLGPDQTMCIDDSIQLNAQGGDTFSWSVLSGSPIVVGTNFSCDSCADPIVKPDTTTTYVVVSDLSNTCNNTDTITIFVTNQFTIAIDSVGPFCSNDSAVNLTVTSNGPPGNWFGTGITDITAGTFDPSVAGAGTHTIIYSIGGSCGNTGSLDITVIEPPDATIIKGDLFCALDTLDTMIAATPGGIWSGPPIIDPTLGTINPSLLTGIDTVLYSVSDSICASTDTILVSSTTQLDATIDTSLTGPFCLTDPSVNFQATNLGGSWSGTGIVDTLFGTFDPATAGVGSFTIFYSFEGACGDTDSVVVQVFDIPNTTITPVGPFCDTETQTVTLTTASTGGEWAGTAITNPNSGTFVPANLGAGTFTAIYADTTGSGCGSSDTTTIVINATPTAPILAYNGPYCAGELMDSIYAIGDTAATRIWFSDSALTDTVHVGNQLPAVAATQTTTYWVIQVRNGCVGPASSIDVVVFPFPTVSFTASPTIGPPPLQVTFTNTSVPDTVPFFWDFGDGGTSNDTNPDYTYTLNGIYTVNLVNVSPFGCVNQDSLQIFVFDSVQFIVPNVFTPNGDGVNDIWDVEIIGAVAFEVAVFNRWGDKVYEWKDFPHYWDGYLHNDGVYFYVMKAEGYDGKTYQHTGHVTLIGAPR